MDGMRAGDITIGMAVWFYWRGDRYEGKVLSKAIATNKNYAPFNIEFSRIENGETKTESIVKFASELHGLKGFQSKLKRNK